MRIRIRHDSPVPLYHQIAEAIRNSVAVGELLPGSRLPSVRDGADEWGVNLHTVRRAYGELARERLVVMDRRGTRIREVAAVEADSVDQLLAKFVRTAWERFGLTQMQVGQLLLKRAAAGMAVPVYFLECSEEQAAGHCAEIMTSWRVDARPLVLGRTAELPRGIVISTFFHYNDVRQQWPDRTDAVRFVAIAPDPEIGRELPSDAEHSGPRRLLVCELDEPKAVNIAADLSVLLPPPRFRIEPRVLSSPSSLPDRGPGDVLLVAPRVWGAMSEAARQDVVLIRYRLRDYELDALGKSFGWAARAAAGAA